MNQIHRHALYLGFMLACACVAAGAAAETSLASREADRQAKAAVPLPGETLIYVYRPADSNTAPIAVTVAGADTRRLTPATFVLWRVKPRRHELRVEQGRSIALPTEGGRVYYVELTRTSSGAPALRPVSFASGRAQVQRAWLVGPARAPAPAPVPKRAPAPKPAPAPARPRAAAAPAPSLDSSAHGALTFKLGSLSLAQDTQTILGSARQFESSASSELALEGEWFFRPDTSLGGEFVKYSNPFSTPGSSGSGEADTMVFLANGKRYFVLADEWTPYVGAGAGFASTDFSGAISGSTSGFALQLTGGLQWRRGSFALRAEYKYLRAKTEDDTNQQVDASGSGLFFGAGFYF